MVMGEMMKRIELRGRKAAGGFEVLEVELGCLGGGPAVL